MENASNYYKKIMYIEQSNFWVFVNTQKNLKNKI